LSNWNERGKIFDADYYERGTQTGKSLYENYRWLPHLTFPLVMKMIDFLEISPEKNHRILDFGCAKGYVVLALRQLGYKAWGCDISQYALSQVPVEVKQYCSLNSEDNIIPFTGNDFDFVIGKDVLEHVEKEDMVNILKALHFQAHNLFFVIPLAKNGKYIAVEHEFDITHIIREDANWWIDIFHKNGWGIKSFSYQVSGMKEQWKKYEKGIGFFVLEEL